MTTRSLVLPVLLGGLLLAGCTGSNDVEGDGDEPVEIVIEGFAYRPETVTVPAGTRITFVNQDDFAHTATSGEPGAPTEAFDLQLGELGEHASSGKMADTVLGEPGRFDYFCRFHPRMTATVIVEER